MADQIHISADRSIADVIEQAVDLDKLRSFMRPYTDQALTVIESEIKQRLPDGATGNLRNDLTHVVSLEADAYVPGLLGSVLVPEWSPANKYALFVEDGREPGTPPPYKDILPWAQRKVTSARHKETGKRVNTRSKKFQSEIIGIAIAIAKSIGKHGTKGQHPFALGYDAAQSEAARILEIGVDSFFRQGA